MDKPLYLRDEKVFDEFADRDAFGIADGEQKLMELGIELGANVLAFQSHDSKHRAVIEGGGIAQIIPIDIRPQVLAPQDAIGFPLQCDGKFFGAGLIPVADIAKMAGAGLAGRSQLLPFGGRERVPIRFQIHRPRVSPSGDMSSTPFGDFTIWCKAAKMVSMENQDVVRLRRLKLRKWIDSHFGGNASDFARKVKRRQSQIQDMLKENGTKSFGEKIARALEKKAEMPLDYLVRPEVNDDGKMSYHGVQLTRAAALLAAEWEKMDVPDRVELEAEIHDRVAKKVRRGRQRPDHPLQPDKPEA